MDWKKFGKMLLFPPVWLILILSVASAVSLALVFIKKLDTHPIAYAVYVVAFYTLVVLSCFCAVVLPKRYKTIKQKIYANSFGNRYMTDAAFRTRISLYISLIINLLYVCANALSGFIYHTQWFYILAGYYGILAIMRFLLVRYVHQNPIGTNMLGEWKRSRICAYTLTLVNLSLSAVILMMMYQDKGFRYNGILIYVMAAYTFYITTLAIINLVKYRKLGSPVMSMTKIINMVAALVSMLSLETAMFSQFGKDMSNENKQIFIMLTGAGVSIIIVTMSVYSIVKNSREIKQIMENKTYGE